MGRRSAGRLAARKPSRAAAAAATGRQSAALPHSCTTVSSRPRPACDQISATSTAIAACEGTNSSAEIGAIGSTSTVNRSSISSMPSR